MEVIICFMFLGSLTQWYGVRLDKFGDFEGGLPYIYIGALIGFLGAFSLFALFIIKYIL